MGGGTSLVAVGEGHVDAAALVLVDIAPRLEVEGAAKIGAFMGQGADGFATLDEVADAIAAYQPHRPRPRQLDGLAKNVRLGADGRYHWHWDPAFRARTRDLEERHVRLEACARNLDLPTLLVRGGLSDILTEEGAAGVPRASARAPSTSTSPAPPTWWPVTATTCSARRSSSSCCGTSRSRAAPHPNARPCTTSRPASTASPTCPDAPRRARAVSRRRA